MLEKSHLGYFSWNDKTGIFFIFFFKACPLYYSVLEIQKIDSSYKTILKIKRLGKTLTH